MRRQLAVCLLRLPYLGELGTATSLEDGRAVLSLGGTLPPVLQLGVVQRMVGGSLIAARLRHLLIGERDGDVSPSVVCPQRAGSATPWTAI